MSLCFYIMKTSIQYCKCVSVYVVFLRVSIYIVLTSSASWSARCCMSDSSLRMSASSAMAAGCGGWRRSPTGKRRSWWEFGEGWKRGGERRMKTLAESAEASTASGRRMTEMETSWLFSRQNEDRYGRYEAPDVHL